MTTCYRDDEIAAVAALPANDARRTHLEECPRCRALLVAFDEFMREPAADIGRIDEADAALARAIEREVALPATPGASTAPAGPPGGVFRAIERWFSPRTRLAWGVAAVAVVVAGTWVAIGPRPERAGTWRGERDPAAPALEVRARPASDGRTIVLEWRAAAGASAYLVRITREDLSELAVLEAGAETRYDLWLDAPPLATEDVRTLFVQVEARAGDRSIARSRPLPLDAR
jgi:hypothetical protein